MTMKAALAVLIALLTAGSAGQALAGGKPARVTRATVSEPVKDCARVNGRYGYYGNPFCTPAEQRVFDRWEARRLGR